MATRYPRKVNVRAVEDPRAEDGVRFRMEDDDGHELQTLVFSKDHEPGMKKKDEHEVRFKLVQEPGMTLEFAQDPDVAFWVAWGTEDSPPACPAAQPDNPDPVIYAEHSAPTNLRVVNKNPDQKYFSFSLNFVDRHSTNPARLIRYDPVGENKDGGIAER